MNSPPLHTNNPVSRRSAYALVISLLFMGFVLLLVTSLSSFIQVELHSSAISSDVDRARENAALGLQIAVARLQESVGLDQRFTATSAITGASKNANITGVWEVGASDATTWLVSGNGLSDPLARTPSNLPSPVSDADEDEVFLVNYGSVSEAEDRIKLPKESISSDIASGHYAYWIGDEGVKVSMAINDETDHLDYDNTLTESSDNAPGSGHDWNEVQYRDELRQMAPSIPNFWMLLGLDLEDVAGSQKLASLSTVSSASLFSELPDSTVLLDNFHSLTPLSRAVLVNHTEEDGSLRQDLSDSPQTERPVKIFTRGRPDELTSGEQGFLTSPYYGSSYSDIFPDVSTGPVITEFLVRYAFYRDSQGRLTMKEEVQVELWNPYTFPIETDQKMWVNIENIPEFKVTVNGVSYDVAVDDYLKSTWVYGAMVPAGVEWDPGEIKWLKGSTGHSVYALAADGPSHSVVILDSNGDEIYIPDPETSATPITIEVTAPAITDSNPYSVTLQTFASIAVYSPQLNYKEVNVANDSDDLNSSSWLFGYAFEMDDDLERWVDGSREDSADPRSYDMDDVDFADQDYDYWSDDPADILSDINLTGFDTFNTQQNYILYDKATQEPVSVGALTNLISARPKMLGNSWGDSANEYFDRYFFSSLPRWYEWDLTSLPLLPNRYIDYFLSGQDDIEIGDKYASAGLDVDIMLDLYHAAKYVMIRGAFNINSTSVDAWRAMLGGIHIQDWSQDDGGAVRDLEYAFFRYSFHAQYTPTALDEPIELDNAFSRSGVTITASQVSSLANAVVALIVERGHPFESLSEFINAGIIEQAIETVEINKDAEDLGIINNSPAYLTQADVIKGIAPMLTPRSDTFLVRSYGDVTNPMTGEVTASVWCEAVVQRTPALTDPDSGEVDLARDPISPDIIKYPYGRKMRILSIRYLSPDEV
jgi:hypothetical protein